MPLPICPEEIKLLGIFILTLVIRFAYARGGQASVTPDIRALPLIVEEPNVTCITPCYGWVWFGDECSLSNTISFFS